NLADSSQTPNVIMTGHADLDLQVRKSPKPNAPGGQLGLGAVCRGDHSAVPNPVARSEEIRHQKPSRIRQGFLKIPSVSVEDGQFHSPPRCVPLALAVVSRHRLQPQSLRHLNGILKRCTVVDLMRQRRARKQVNRRVDGFARDVLARYAFTKTLGAILEP